MTKFVRFEETNDHEGETWNWWLQLDGNEQALHRFAAALDEESVEFDIEYVLEWGDIEPEFIVDKLVEYATGGYNPSHNKVTGKFTCPGDLGVDGDVLYKGRIQDFFS